MPSSQDRPTVLPPEDVVNAATAPIPAASPPQPVRSVMSERDNSRAPTGPVFTARHLAPPPPGRRQAPVPDSSSRFARRDPDPYSPPAAYSAVAHPGRPHPARPDPVQRYPAPMNQHLDADGGAARMSTTQRPHRRVDTSVLCAAAALALLALAVVIGLLL